MNGLGRDGHLLTTFYEPGSGPGMHRGYLLCFSQPLCKVGVIIPILQMTQQSTERVGGLQKSHSR